MGFEPLKFDTTAFDIMISLSSACFAIVAVISIYLFARLAKHPLPQPRKGYALFVVSVLFQLALGFWLSVLLYPYTDIIEIPLDLSLNLAMLFYYRIQKEYVMEYMVLLYKTFPEQQTEITDGGESVREHLKTGEFIRQRGYVREQYQFYALAQLKSVAGVFTRCCTTPYKTEEIKTAERMQLSTSIWLLIYVLGVPIILVLLVVLTGTDQLYVKNEAEERQLNLKTCLSALKFILLFTAMCKLMTYIRAMDHLIPPFKGMKRFLALKGVKLLLTV